MADRWNKAENDAVYRDRAAFGGQQGYAQNAANNYTSLGQAAAQRGAYQNNWAQNDASRAQQGNAMGLMQSAANGSQPSQAQMLARNMNDQAVQNQMAMAASARGGSLAQAAAMRNAQSGMAAQQQQAANQMGALRAQEMAQARGDYFGAASGMRGMDMQQQGMNMQSELAQRQLNQQGQQFNDQMAWNTMKADQDGANHRAALDSQEYLAQKQMDQHSTDRETGVIASAIGAAGSTLANVFDWSDVRSKTDVKPLDGGPKQMGLGAAIGQGFGSFGRNASAIGPEGRGLLAMSGPAPASLDRVSGGGLDVLGSLKAHSDVATQFARKPIAEPIKSDERTKQDASAPGEDPMASANRALEGSSYAYKPEFRPPEQAPGEQNVGPMAQNMAADPVASTAVKKDPETGMLALDHVKMTKLNSAGIASLQKQIDSLAAAAAKRKGAK